jgi:ubiquinone/menaquinone biosynthesis C-methylase UbiE
VRRVFPRSVERELGELREADPWFHDHFEKVPRIIAEHLRRVIPLESSQVLDFGCGEGLMAKGLARFAREVHGVDVMLEFLGLEERLKKTFRSTHRLPRVSLRLVGLGEPLPYPDGMFDGVFAWSVFEHVAEIGAALAEIVRVLRPGGAFFLQIAPLYCSPHGGHLWGILDEPWIHLRLHHEELFRRIRNSSGIQATQHQLSTIQLQKPCREFQESIIDCFRSLNRVTVGQLMEQLRAAGLDIVHQQMTNECPYTVPDDLLMNYSHEDLTTDQVVVLMTRPATVEKPGEVGHGMV